MNIKHRARRLLVLALFLASVPFFLSTPNVPKADENLVARAAATLLSSTSFTSDAPTKAWQENQKHGQDARQNSADDGAAAARVRDARKGLVRLRGEVPAALASAERLHGAARDDSPLALTVVLDRTDQQGFEAFLRGVQDSQSPTYRHYLSPREQARRFGPSPQAYDAVLAWLRRKGFRLLEGSANRLTLTVRATRARAQQAFGVEIGDYQIGNRTFYANDRDPVVPEQIAPYVQAVIGLSNLAEPGASDEEVNSGYCSAYAEAGAPNDPTYQGCLLRHPSICFEGECVSQCDILLHDIKKNLFQACMKNHGQGPSSGGNGPNSGGSNSSSFSAPQLLPAQAAAALRWLDVNGTGQTVGLLEFDTFNRNDIRDYLALAGYPSSDINRLSQVHVNGGAPLGAEESEVLIDIIAVMVNARGANVVVYDAPFTGNSTNFQALFNRMIGDGVTVISNSWSYCEDQTTLADAQSLDAILASAAAAGISVFNGSGDSGSTCLDGSANTIGVPADSPHATAVGGTSLILGPALTYGHETAWLGLGNIPPTGQGGFGVSRFFSRPTYQNGFNSSPMRSIPDVGVNADPANGIEICQADAGGCPTGLRYGGTSLSAPLWAAFAALLNQAQGQNLGQLNPLLYPLGNTDAFHSATSMGSDFQHVGLGSPNLNLMHRTLSGKTVGGVSSSVSEISAEPLNVVADGTAESFVVVRLRDADGHTVSGKTVTLAAGAGAHATITPASGVSNVSNGAVIFSLKDTVPEIVTFTATDTTDSVVLQKQVQVAFVARPATAGGISASPSTVNANGSDMTTITVTLQDANGNPSPGKVVNLSQGNGASIITTTTATTDATGKVQFTAVSNKAETVTYTAVDVTDRNLPIPGSAIVNFVNASGFCGRNEVGTAAPGYSVSTFASNFPLDCFSPKAPIGLAFDANGNLFVGDVNNNSIYSFGPQGGIAGPATLVVTVPSSFGASLAGLTFAKDGRLYAGLNNGSNIVEVNPATGAVIRVVATLPDGPLDLHVDPLSGDLFVSVFGGIYRITNFNNGPGTVTLYFQGGFIDGFVFAPDGTIYLKGGTEGIFRVTGTNTQNPGTATQLAFVVGGPDGIALEQNPANPAKPFLYVNRNDGIITRIDTSALPPNAINCNDAGAPCTNIYTGGSRGDFVTVGPSGCLYATQSDRVIRVTKADGTCSLSPTNPAPQIVLTPESVQPSPVQGTTVTLTATVKNVANPAGIPVTLFVNGANPSAHLVRTDTNGNVTFTYTGVSTGTDQSFAAADLGGSTIFSNDAKVTWTPGKHSTFLSVNLSPTSGTVNRPLTLAATLADISTAPIDKVGGVPLNFSLAGQICTGTTDANGTAACTITPNVAAGSYQLEVTFAGTSALLASSAKKTVDLIETPVVLPAIRFSNANYQVGEGDGRVVVTVNRSGDTSGAVSVGYQTLDTDAFRFGCADTVNNQGGAYGRCDYATVVGTLNFAAGETSKNITVPIIDDVYVEGNETFQITLANAVAATLGTPANATVTITDNDTAAGAPNPIFRGDFFVRQHYLDFLSREPEAAGLAAWLNVLNNCPDVNNTDPNSPSATCDRILVSQSFFGSPEFQLKGTFVFRFYRLAFNRLPRYSEIVFDMSAVTGRTAADTFARKAAFTDSFAQRQEFTAAYGGLSNTDYVNALLGRYGLTQITCPDPAAPDGMAKVTLTTSELTGQLNAGTLTRAQVLRAVADSDQVGAAEFTRAFVAAEYYGYLRRTPDTPGYNAWLNYLTTHPTDARTMVNGFLNSQEYKLRFGPP
ncbi:MAG: protease pro-enzyme activation domain-containing protein [Pyrinomonadaceae bacterium]